MYYEYAMRQAKEVAEIKGHLYGYQVILDGDDSSDEDAAA
jgi:hypothetical protein